MARDGQNPSISFRIVTFHTEHCESVVSCSYIEQIPTLESLTRIQIKKVTRHSASETYVLGQSKPLCAILLRTMCKLHNSVALAARLVLLKFLDVKAVRIQNAPGS